MNIRDRCISCKYTTSFFAKINVGYFQTGHLTFFNKLFLRSKIFIRYEFKVPSHVKYAPLFFAEISVKYYETALLNNILDYLDVWRRHVFSYLCENIFDNLLIEQYTVIL